MEQWGQVRIAAAFDSPDTLQSALAFLREYAADTGAHAACAVVPRSHIAFPQACNQGLPVLAVKAVPECFPRRSVMHQRLPPCQWQPCKGG